MYSGILLFTSLTLHWFNGKASCQVPGSTLLEQLAHWAICLMPLPILGQDFFQEQFDTALTQCGIARFYFCPDVLFDLVAQVKSNNAQLGSPPLSFSGLFHLVVVSVGQPEA